MAESMKDEQQQQQQQQQQQHEESSSFPLTPTKSWKEYFFRRMKYSNIYTCWYQNDMDISDSDNIVNSVTVVNALLLTIPFNLLGAYNESFWAWEMNNIATCNNGIYNETSGQFIPSFLNDLGLDLYLNVSSKIFNCTFAAVIGLFLAAIYYTLRPKNQAIFAQWWPRGKISIILILIFTSIAMISLLYLFGMSVGLVLSSSQYSCYASGSIIRLDSQWRQATVAVLIVSCVFLI